LLTRSGAKTGDGIFVTGSLGLPSFILEYLLANNMPDNIPANVQVLIDSKANKLYYPKSRVNIGKLISQYASSAIDISDGLIADLGHILTQSNIAAELYLNKLPIDPKLLELSCDNNININIDDIIYNQKYNNILKYALIGGDEYELLFTAPLIYKEKLINNKEAEISYIGNIVDMFDRVEQSEISNNIQQNLNKFSNLILLDAAGKQVHLDFMNDSWLHFKD
jgi:thiamine-monophosphate kinase